MNNPDYIIIGETKCGTTSLYNYLIQHPRILDTYGNGDKVDKIYATKEIRYFDRYYSRGPDWYKSCFPSTQDDEITGEATPMYMYRSLAAKRIQSLLPNIKLIIQLRNPVDRLYSNFQHNLKWVPDWSNLYPTFEDFLNTVHDKDYYLIEKGIYISSFLKWLKYFKRDQFFIICLEDLQTNPDKIYNEVLNFLQVSKYSLTEYEKFRGISYKKMRQSTREMLLEFYFPYNQELFSHLNDKFKWDN